MTHLVEAIALAALVPAMTGPLARDGANLRSALVMSLCGGGTMALPLDTWGVPGSAVVPCCAKGCRSRRRAALDQEQ